MKIEKICKIKDGRQDGAVSNGYFFSFNHKGECTVYRMESLMGSKDNEAEPFSEFVLDKSDMLMPHSNSVAFGNEYYSETDEFPLLYTNIYNNYSAYDDKLKGVCLVYRLQRDVDVFRTTLVQMIEIGFTEDETLWKSAGEKEDVRPYGNFAVDNDRGILYAFTMRDNTFSARYFAFELPKAGDGELCPKYGVKRVTLTSGDILEYFDCDYHNYVQGAICHNGKIYSLEGFTDNSDNPAAIRIIDTQLKKQTAFRLFGNLGNNTEPEMIDFYGDSCYYCDHNGNMYKLSFD